MDFKQIAIKAGKGAATAAGAVVAVKLADGVPMTKASWISLLAVIGGAAFHGAWNVIEQYLSGGSK